MGESRKIIKLLGLFAIATLFALLFYLMIIHLFINNYIYQAGFDERSILINEFCKTQSILNLSKEKIIIIGPSTAIEDVNANILEAKLNGSYAAYNFGIPGSDPALNSLMMECIISMKPSMIIYVFIDTHFVTNNNPESISRKTQILALMSDYINLEKNDTRYGFLNSDEKEVLSWNLLERDIFKRKFIINFFLNCLKTGIGKYSYYQYKTAAGYFHDLKNPTFAAFEPKKEINISDPGIISQKSLAKEFKINDTSIIAFEYIIKEFKQNNISIILVNAPEHSILNDKLSNTELVFNSYFNNLCKNKGCDYFNFKYAFENESETDLFMDSVHLSMAGKEKFSGLISQNIIENEKRMVQRGK